MEDAMDDTLEGIIGALKALESTSAELWQYEALAGSMRRLADQKRAELLSANVATNIMERLFSEPDATKRVALADELRRETLRRLHDIRWTFASNNDRDLAELEPVGRQLVQVYEMLNACAASGESLPADLEQLNAITIDFEYDPDVCLKFVTLEYDHAFLIEQLVASRLISREDADLFLDMLNEVTLPFEHDIKPRWQGTMRELVNFVIIGSEIGVFKVVSKKQPTGRDKKGPAHLAPSYESAIINTFAWGDKGPYKGISREYINPTRAALPAFVQYVKERHPRGGFSNNPLISALSETSVDETVAAFEQKFPDLDVGVMQIFDAVLAHEG